MDVTNLLAALDVEKTRADSFEATTKRLESDLKMLQLKQLEFDFKIWETHEPDEVKTVPYTTYLEVTSQQEARIEKLQDENEYLEYKVRNFDVTCADLEQKLKNAETFGLAKIQAEWIVGKEEEKRMGEEMEKLMKYREKLETRMWKSDEKDFEHAQKKFKKLMEKILEMQEKLENLKQKNMMRTMKKVIVEQELENEDLRFQLEVLKNSILSKEKRIENLENQCRLNKAKVQTLNFSVRKQQSANLKQCNQMVNFHNDVVNVLQLSLVQARMEIARLHEKLRKEQDINMEIQKFVSKLMQNTVLDRINKDTEMKEIEEDGAEKNQEVQRNSGRQEAVEDSEEAKEGVTIPIENRPRIRWSDSWDIEILDDIEQVKPEVAVESDEWKEAKGRTWKTPKIAKWEYSVEEIKSHKKNNKRKVKKSKHEVVVDLKKEEIVDVVEKVIEEVKQQSEDIAEQVEPVQSSRSSIYWVLVMLFLGLIFVKYLTSL